MFWRIYMFSAPLNMKNWILVGSLCESLCVCACVRMHASLAPESLDSPQIKVRRWCILLHPQIRNVGFLETGFNCQTDSIVVGTEQPTVEYPAQRSI
jgi:hypothetical protein